MRRDVDRLLTQLATQQTQWLEHLETVNARHDAERAEWAEERRMLMNAALAESGAEFNLRQRASDERPVTERGEREPRPAIIGM